MANGQIAFYVDVTRCINCKTCEVACKDRAQAPPGVRLRRVRTYEAGDFPAVFAWNVSMACNHCESPACVEQCPVGAYTKRAEDGIVVHDRERCIGCRYCTWVCPYGAPQYDPALRRVRKCDLCVDELAQDRQPACVTACPMRAIEVGPLSEIAARPHVTIALRHAPSPERTRPACRYRIRPEATNG